MGQAHPQSFDDHAWFAAPRDVASECRATPAVSASGGGVYCGTDDSVLMYLAESDWQAAVSRIEAERQAHLAPLRLDRRVTGERQPAVLTCLIRVESRPRPRDQTGDTPAGVHLVRSRNLSPGGMAVLHGGELPVGAACVVAIECPHGQGLIARATVCWCRGVEASTLTQPAFELGLRFDQPVEVGHLLDPI